MKPDSATLPNPEPVAASRSWVSDVVVLAKVRVNALVVATTAGGYYMAAPATIDPGSLVAACIGTALVASGAAAVNQVYERDTDQLMTRTRQRPVAAGRMTAQEGYAIAAVLSVTGLAVLWVGANVAAMLVALATLLSYALAYTPLKRITSLSTVVGAVPGALPPIIGWAAAGGALSIVAPWTMFLIVFLWQLPHVLAIGWIYRDEYARAGLPILPVVDPHGRLTGAQAMLWAATLVPFTQLPTLLGMTNSAYAIGALVLGIVQFVLAARFAYRRTNANARALFYASITYLPLLWALMCVGRK